jgi:hypothetical protein
MFGVCEARPDSLRAHVLAVAVVLQVGGAATANSGLDSTLSRRFRITNDDDTIQCHHFFLGFPDQEVIFSR